MCAVKNDDEKMVDKLIASGADINATDKFGKTALFYAVLKGNEKMVEKLIKCGADINAADKFGKTALFYAVLKGNEKMVEKLIKCGADINATDKAGQTALFFSVEKVNEKLVQKFIECGADVISTDKAGQTAFFFAVKKCMNESVARALVCGSADVNITDNEGKTALFFANWPTLVLFSVLTVICKDKSPDAHWKKDAAETILTSTKCPVNGNDNEDSPLHYCCRNIVEVSKALPEEEVRNTVHWGLAKLLCSFGADYRITDATDQSCLDIAEKCPALKNLLLEPIDLDRFPVLIRPWKSISKTHERCLARVARHLESEDVESYWYHKDHLASGSFAAVFAGINEKDGREVAIKRIEKRHMKRSEDKREIENFIVLADCDQVVLYLHFFEDRHFSYIVLELMEGNLDELLDHTIVTKVMIRVQLCQDVVGGLVYLHDQNILHRDLKPANILYKWHPKLCLKIADFGLSRRIDCNSTTVYGTNAGTRCCIAPEVLSFKKPHSKSSDVFACGLVLHYILSVKKHPFAPRIGALQHEIEANISNGKMEGWDDSLCPEAGHLLKRMLDGDESKRPSAEKALDHPFFWSKKKKRDLLIAVGNQPEFECPRGKRTLPLTAVETDLEATFGAIVKYVHWNNPGYVHMPAIYTEMTRRRKYRTNSVVELVRFIRNSYAHVTALPKAIQDQLLKDFVFLEYFPNLVMEVYKAVTTHGWDQTREEIEHAL